VHRVPRFKQLMAQRAGGCQVLYLCYAVDVYSQFEYIVATIMVATVGFLVAMYKVMKYLEKPTCYMLGLAVFLPFVVTLYFLPRSGTDSFGNWQVYVVSAGAGIGIGTCFLLPWAMLPDTIDSSELISGSRHEG
jgi:Na+/melibiose symporter-like transporter